MTTHVRIVIGLLAFVLGIALFLSYKNAEHRDMKEARVEDGTYRVCDEDGTIYASEAEAERAGLSLAQYGATYCDVLTSYTDGNTTIYPVYHLLSDTVSFTLPETGDATLPIARSGSGARYANSNESLVFWEHQEELTITKDDVEIFRGMKEGSKEGSLMREEDARRIAETSCVKGGEALGPGSYNPNSKTWWFDANLNSRPEGCSPACVVSEESGTAEINWRCTGLAE